MSKKMGAIHNLFLSPIQYSSPLLSLISFFQVFQLSDKLSSRLSENWLFSLSLLRSSNTANQMASLEPILWKYKNFSGQQAVGWGKVIVGEKGRWHHYLVIKTSDQSNTGAGDLVNNEQPWHFFKTTLKTIFTYLKMCAYVCVKYAISSNHFRHLWNLPYQNRDHLPFWVTFTMAHSNEEGASTASDYFCYGEASFTEDWLVKLPKP